MADPTPRAYIPPQRPLRAVAPRPVLGASPTRPVANPPLRRNIYWGGFFCIRGTVTTLHGTGTASGIPTHARVRLLDERTSILIGECWSHPTTGHYQFNDIADGTYTVIAYDRTGTYRAVIADRVRAVPMGDA